MDLADSQDRIIVKSEREIAYSSPDHLHPWGTRRDNSRNRRFNEKLYQLFSQQAEILKILDLGCSGGGFVKDCLDDGCLAVGIEGSDFSKRRRRAEWGTIPDFLFTCDVTGDFDVFITDKQGELQRVVFDVVTSWELIEHIAEPDLASVARNVKKHLSPSGLWISSISPNEEAIGGVWLHQTVKPKTWWISKLVELGFHHIEAYSTYFNTQLIRGPKYGAPGSFHLFLSLDPSKAPTIPFMPIRGRVYDLWLGSRAQRLLRRLVVGS